VNINGNRNRFTLLAAALALASTQVQAGASLGNVKWDGFFNAVGAINDSDADYLEHIDDNGDYRETDFGLVATAQLNRRLRIAGQIHMTTDDINFDWGYANYTFTQNITGRAGKIKYPGNLVSEYVDVGLAYPWVRPPESIYSESAEMTFEAYTGAGGLYEGGDDITYSFNLYGGQITGAESGGDDDHDKLIGAVFTLSNDYGEFKLNANQSTLDAEGQPMHGEDRTFLSAGIRGEWNKFILYSEFVRSEISNFSAQDTDSWYATVGYHFGKTMPHLTYQDYEVDSGVEQTSWTLGVKQTLTASSALKLELQRVSDIKNGGLFLQQPGDSDVYLLNAALNFVF